MKHTKKLIFVISFGLLFTNPFSCYGQFGIKFPKGTVLDSLCLRVFLPENITLELEEKFNKRIESVVAKSNEKHTFYTELSDCSTAYQLSYILEDINYKNQKDSWKGVYMSALYFSPHALLISLFGFTIPILVYYPTETTTAKHTSYLNLKTGEEVVEVSSLESPALFASEQRQNKRIVKAMGKDLTRELKRLNQQNKKQHKLEP
ncbi:MAG: hypothetical protein ACXITV_04360 [Luteibaculaceae bacterium]